MEVESARVAPRRGDEQTEERGASETIKLMSCLIQPKNIGKASRRRQTRHKLILCTRSRRGITEKKEKGTAYFFLACEAAASENLSHASRR